jgi:hypothetical protein
VRFLVAETEFWSGFFLVEFVRKWGTGKGVEVQNETVVVVEEYFVDKIRDHARVVVKKAQECSFVDLSAVPEDLALASVGVENAHSDCIHLLAIIGKPLDIDHEARQRVDH